MNQQPIYTFAKWKVKEGALNTVLALLENAISKSREEQGNLFYKIHQDIRDKNMLLLFEGYTDEAALEVHRNSDHFQTIVVESIVPLLKEREVMLATELFIGDL